MAYYKCGSIHPTQNSNTVIDTASGPIANFETPLAMPLLDTQISVNAVQDLHGQSGAYPAGGGVNKFDKDTMVVSGYYIADTDGQAKPDSGSSCTDYVEINPNTSYYIKTEQTVGQWAAWYDENKDYISGFTMYNRAVTSPSTAKYIRLTILRSGSGNVDTFCINYPATDTAYHPYSNICPISGHNSALLLRTGKNLLNKESYEWISNSNIIFGGTNTTISGNLILSPGTYTLSCSHNVTGFYVDNNDEVVKRAYNTSSTTFSISSRQAVRINFYIAGVTQSDLLNFNYQLELGSVATAYEPYAGNEYIINLGGTYYGGYVSQDKDGKRELVVTRIAFDDWANKDVKLYGINTHGIANFYLDHFSQVTKANVGICNLLTKQTSLYSDTTEEGFLVNPSTQYIRLLSTRASTVDEFKTWATDNNLMIINELETPFTVALPDGQPIKSFVGINNIYADTGDTSLQFRKIG